MRIAILKSDNDTAHSMWLHACEDKGLAVVTIDLSSYDWLRQLRDGAQFDILLACPSGEASEAKQLYDEKLGFIEDELNLRIYPKLKEIKLHENKRYLSDWLAVNNLPHAETYVFYQREEALAFARQFSTYPIVAKSNIGASGSGVKFIQNHHSLVRYIRTAFSNGVKRYSGPNLRMGSLLKRGYKVLVNKNKRIERAKKYLRISKDREKRFIILQEYISHNYEWRLVKIGESYFGHKKMKTGSMASGTKLIQYDLPSVKLLNFFKSICDTHSFSCISMDCFEHSGMFYVNELQTVFGHVQDHICEKNGTPGRLLFSKGEWMFEEGSFNQNLSFSLRLDDALSLCRGKCE